jgi:hypothetical protein
MTLISEAFTSLLIVYLFLRSYLNLSLTRTQAEPSAALNRKSSILLPPTCQLHSSSYSCHFYSCRQRSGPRNLIFGFVSLVHRYMVGFHRLEIGSLRNFSTYRGQNQLTNADMFISLVKFEPKIAGCSGSRLNEKFFRQML